MPQQPDPDWLIQARKVGRILSETGVNLSGQGGNVSTPDPRVTEGESEAEFQKRVIDLAQSLGWRVAHFRKVRVMRANGDVYWETPVAADGKGFPDLLMLRDSDLVAMELKVGKNRTTPEQREWIGALLMCHVEALIYYPEDWDKIVRTLT